MSKYFKIEEFCKSASHPELVRVPQKGTEIYNNLEKLANELDKVREKFQKPICVSSGWRPKALNDAVGGSKTSAYLKGMAADVYSKNGNADNVNILKSALNSGLKQDQYIAEYPTFDRNGNLMTMKWLHIGISSGTPRGQVLYFDGKSYKSLNVVKDVVIRK